MACSTSTSLRNIIIYEVYVRNHGRSGTFKDIQKDLQRIMELGTDIIWFMPIHPVGVKNKKGSLGCPYSIRNYKEVNPEYGSLDDFKMLINEIHKKNMRVMIDIVFNHTSPDSFLYENHPEYFYRKPDGNVGNKVGDWSDVIDLDYSNGNLCSEQIEVLKYWVNLGVDGFRCDVAPLIPLSFWMQARKELSLLNKDLIWLSESVSPDFIIELRKQGYTALSDSQIYDTFDIAYDYDVYTYFERYLKGRITLDEYLEKIRQQEYIYPYNYVKLRFLENHDRPRAKKLFSDTNKLKVWTAFIYFQKGAVLLYAGQEAQDTNTPSLFDIDKVNWQDMNDDFTDYLKMLGKLKKEEIFSKGYYCIHDTYGSGCIFATYEYANRALVGLFNVEGKGGKIKTGLKDGTYKNLIGNDSIRIIDGNINLTENSAIFEIE